MCVVCVCVCVCVCVWSYMYKSLCRYIRKRIHKNIYIYIYIIDFLSWTSLSRAWDMAYSRRALAYNIWASYNKYITVSATRGYRTQNLLIYKAVLRPVGPPAGLYIWKLYISIWRRNEPSALSGTIKSDTYKRRNIEVILSIVKPHQVYCLIWCRKPNIFRPKCLACVHF